MTRRREFTRDVKAQIVLRATTASGHLACEGCGLILGRRPYHIDHKKADALEVDKRRRLTAEDGQLLGVECCHKKKSREDVKAISKAKRVEAKHLGVARPAGKLQSRGFAPAPPQQRARKPLGKSLPPRAPMFE